MATRDYTVEVKTSKRPRAAGTDDDVFVKIDGGNGTTDWVKLNNKMKNDFERGNVDRFNFTGQNLGGITNVELSKSGKDGWRCDYVKVIDVTGKRAYQFDFFGWIGIDPVPGKPHNPKPPPPPKPNAFKCCILM